ncbi:Twinkle protein, mitochondrial [Smittium mucronatum]|uniref:Twinkle protein, mitochondrial n=1 Tax=Smittium mucronatum TaxID=133383 RepID=A0A1R0GNA9_9FUNG|nr:Twinkle protein, mitochondrial [Smittium mucronatum]
MFSRGCINLKRIDLSAFKEFKSNKAQSKKHFSCFPLNEPKISIENIPESFPVRFKKGKSFSTATSFIRAKALGSSEFVVEDAFKNARHSNENDLSTINDLYPAKDSDKNSLPSHSSSSDSFGDSSPNKNEESDFETRNDENTAHEMKNLFILTHQYPRPGLKKTELLVKCPSCSPGKPLKSSYCATLDVESLQYSCNSCFVSGSWDEYKYLAEKELRRPSSDVKHDENNSKMTIDSGYFKRGNEQFEINHKLCVDIVNSNHKRLLEDSTMLKKLIGTKKDDFKFLPSTIERYNVGLMEINYSQDSMPSQNTNIDSNTGSLDINDQYQKCYAFHLSALKMDIEQIILNNVGDNSIEFTPTAIKAYDSNFDLVKTILLDTYLKNGISNQKIEPLSKFQKYISNDSSMETSPDLTVGLFGLDTVPLDCNRVILTGDELDAMAAYQMTGVPSISLPSSTLQLPVNLIAALERFEQIYIWLEDNFIGREASVTIAKKLGTERCLVIHNRDLMPVLKKKMKSKPLTLLSAPANSDVIRSPAEVLQMARPIQHEKIVTFGKLYNSIVYELMNPELIKGVPTSILPGYNETIKGLRPGELTIFSGPTGSGKTTVLSSLSLDFCKQRVPTLWGSFEIPNTRLASRMLTQFAGVPLKGDQQLIQKYSSKFRSLPLYFLKFHGSTQPEIVMETMRHAVYAYDVKHIIIDNLQFMMSMQHFSNNRATGDKYEAQDMAIANFRKFATDEHVHISIVVHTRKEQAGSQLDLNSIFGSAKVTQEADNVIMLQKSGRLSSNKRYDGTLGKIYFQFDPDTYMIKQIPAPNLKSSVQVIKKSKVFDSMIPEEFKQ